MGTVAAENWESHRDDNNTIELQGEQWYVSADTGEHCFNYDPATKTYRFEVRSGDHVDMDRFTDIDTSERSEISMANRKQFPQHFNFEGEIMLEPGDPVTSKWTSLLQLHSGMNKSGPIDMGPRGNDKLTVVVRNDQRENVFSSKGNIPRGQWCKLKVDVQQGNNGHAHVWLNDEKICEFSGQVGYSNQETAHCNMGIYRDEARETLVHNIRNPIIKWGESGHNLNPPGPVSGGGGGGGELPAPGGEGWRTVAVGQAVNIRSGPLTMPIPQAEKGDLIVAQMMKELADAFQRPQGWTGYPEFPMAGGQLVGGYIVAGDNPPREVTYARQGGGPASGHCTVLRRA